MRTHAERPHKPNADGSCESLAHPGERVPADYVWIYRNESHVLLCSPCCARWRRETARQQPVRILSFDGVPQVAS